MKQIVLIALALLMVGQTFSQRRSTNVKGYYRKNGTYVSPHTRHYNAGNSSYSSGSSGKAENDDIPLTSLSITTTEKSDYSIPKSAYGRNVKVVPSTLTPDAEENSPNTSNDIEKPATDGIVIYVSVLRYNGKTIDICPIARGYSGDWDFDKVHHRFAKSSITADEALQLVSDYGWSISGNELQKDFSYEYILNKGLPNYLSKTIEAMKLK